MERETKIQRAINVIEKRPGIRTDELACAIGVESAKVAPLIFAATNSRFILTCKVERQGKQPTNEYRLSAGVVASDWDKYRSIHAAEQVRAKRAEAYRRDTDSAAIKRGVADAAGGRATAEAATDDLENKIEGMSEQIACLQIELEVAQQTIHLMELEAAPAMARTRGRRHSLGDDAMQPKSQPAPKLSTEELASFGRVVPQSIRASVCRKGHWNGLRPIKLPSGKLLWDAEEAARVLNGEVAQ